LEWVEFTNCIEELAVKRDKLQKQRELLQVIESKFLLEMKKLKDLKVIFDDNAVTDVKSI